MISGYFGLPGVGKTTFLAKIAQKELKRISRGKSRYRRVYTNFPCSGCYALEFKDLGTYQFEDCLILLDEVSLEADSRDFKSFTQELRSFFALHRHYGCDIVWFTQAYDSMDKRIRDLTAELFFVKKIGSLTVARRITRMLDVDKESHQIVYGYRLPTIWDVLIPLLWPNAFRLCWRPRWYKYFDSWDAPTLLAHKDVLWSPRK